MAENKMTEDELNELYIFALDLGRKAGKILMDGVDMRCGDEAGRVESKQEEKMNAVDIVTQTDLGELIFVLSKLSGRDGMRWKRKEGIVDMGWDEME